MARKRIPVETRKLMDQLDSTGKALAEMGEHLLASGVWGVIVLVRKAAERGERYVRQPCEGCGMAYGHVSGCPEAPEATPLGPAVSPEPKKS